MNRAQKRRLEALEATVHPDEPDTAGDDNERWRQTLERFGEFRAMTCRIFSRTPVVLLAALVAVPTT